MQEVIIYRSPLEVDMYHSLLDPFFWKCMGVVGICAIIYLIVIMIIQKNKHKKRIKYLRGLL